MPYFVRMRGTTGLCPKPHLRTFEKVLKNPKTFKKGKRGTRFLTLGSAVLRIPSVVRTWGRPVALTSSVEPRRIKPPPQARTGSVRFDLTSVGEGLGPPVETMPHFVRGTTVLYSLPPRGNPQADAWDREAVEGARVTKGLRHSHRNAFSPTRLRREPPPGGGLTQRRNGVAVRSGDGYHPAVGLRDINSSKNNKFHKKWQKKT